MRRTLALLLMVCLAGCVNLKPKLAEKQEPATIDTLQFTTGQKYQIVLPEEWHNAGVEPFLKQTALALQKSLQTKTGLLAPIVSEYKRTADPAIFLGQTRAAEAAGLNLDNIPDYGGLIVERAGDIFLIGRDVDRLSRENVSRNRLNYILGSVKTAVVFMEDYLGTRFLLPGETGTEYGTAQSLPLPKNLRREVKPKLIFATGRHYDLLYDYANNNYGSGRFKSYGGHSYYDAVPAEKYAQDHPEYFALLGETRNSQHNHLCISNPEVQELIYAEVLKQLDAGAEVVQLAQTDGYQACQCQQCQELGNTDNRGEKLWIVHHAMAKRLLKDRPGKKVHIIAYGPTKYPPQSIKAFPDNVIIELCAYTQEIFDLWSQVKVPGGFTVYIYNWGWYQLVGLTPKTSPDTCAEQIRLFLANNVKGIYRCGFGELFGLEGPSYYVYGKMLDESAPDHRQALEDFYINAFQQAAAPMRAFYNALYERLDAMYIRQGMYAFLAEKPSLPKNPRITLGAIYTPDLLESMEKNLARAETIADNDKVKQRLNLVRREFDYVKSLGSVIAFYNSFRLRPDKHNFGQLADTIDARNAMINDYYNDKGAMRNLPGWPEIVFLGRAEKSIVKQNGRLNAPLSAPFTWNIALLRKQNVIPGISIRVMTAPKTVQGPIGRDFDSGVWKNIPWQNLQGIQLGETRAKTMFKVTYDQENIYFAFASTVQPGREYEALGHDGPSWRQDCIELTIDPQGQRQQYYHFVFNPIKNSYYESAYGLITDTLDPRYGKADPSWNGKWSYDGEIRDGLWTVLVTMPFASLGVKQPEKGSRWTMNIGREDYVPTARADKQTIELSLWSPNLETMSFHDRESFGELIFE